MVESVELASDSEVSSLGGGGGGAECGPCRPGAAESLSIMEENSSLLRPPLLSASAEVNIDSRIAAESKRD